MQKTALMALIGVILLAMPMSAWAAGSRQGGGTPPAVPTVAGVSGDPTRGAQIYKQYCVECHGAKGEGRVGVNLVKPFASILPAAFIRQAVSNGVQGSTMPAWSKARGGQLTDQQIDDVTAYVLALQRGTSPTFIEPTPTPTPALGGGATTIIVLIVLIVLVAAIVAFSARGASKS